MNEPRGLEEELGPMLRWHFRQVGEDRCGREVELARYAAGDLLPEERHRFEEHLAACFDCGVDLTRYRAEEPGSDLARPGIWQRLRKLLASRGFQGVALAAAVAAAAIVLIFPRPGDPERLHVKGQRAFELHVAAVHGGQTFRVSDGTTLVPGDQLGFFYSSPTSGHLAIVHASSEEGVTRIFPAAGPASVPVAAGRDVRIPNGAMLSAGQGCEWIVGLFAHRPLGDGEASEIVRRMVAERRGCQLGPPQTRQIEAQVVEVRQEVRP